MRKKRDDPYADGVPGSRIWRLRRLAPVRSTLATAQPVDPTTLVPMSTDWRMGQWVRASRQ